VFEQFRASQNPSMTNNAAMDKANRDGGVALLKRIGPVILLTHSRSGPFGWEIADQVPELVKGIVAVEPNGPPFYNVVPTAPAAEPVLTKPWGLSYIPLTYDPPVRDAADFAVKREERAQGPDLIACWVTSTKHKLAKLTNLQV